MYSERFRRFERDFALVIAGTAVAVDRNACGNGNLIGCRNDLVGLGVCRRGHFLEHILLFGDDCVYIVLCRISTAGDGDVGISTTHFALEGSAGNGYLAISSTQNSARFHTKRSVRNCICGTGTAISNSSCNRTAGNVRHTGTAGSNITCNRTIANCGCTTCSRNITRDRTTADVGYARVSGGYIALDGTALDIGFAGCVCNCRFPGCIDLTVYNIHDAIACKVKCCRCCRQLCTGIGIDRCGSSRAFICLGDVLIKLCNSCRCNFSIEVYGDIACVLICF